MLTLENSPNCGNARITGNARILSIPQLFPEATRRTQPQIHVFGQLSSALAGTFAQIPFGVSLQPPSNPSKQMLVVRRCRFLLKQLAVTELQCLGFQLAQALNLLP